MDAKYVATNVAFTAEQRKQIEAAVETFERANGVKLSRANVLTLLAAKYVKDNQKG